MDRSVSFTEADAHELPFVDDSFMCATVGFGIRNFIDVPRALREMARVVVPGGRVVSLEIVRQDGRDPISAMARLALPVRHSMAWRAARWRPRSIHLLPTVGTGIHVS